MIQRSRRQRQAGFIRKSQCFSRKGSMDLSSQNSLLQSQNLQQFSPFKVMSPEPLSKILQGCRMKSKEKVQDLINEFKYQSDQLSSNNRKSCRKRITSSSIPDCRSEQDQISIEIMQQKIRQFNNYLQTRYNKKQSRIKKDQKTIYKYSNRKMHKKTQKVVCHQYQQEEQTINIINQTIQQIKEIECKPQQINLSLAEAFNLHCHKMKDKLQRERIKFSKHKYQHKRQQYEQIPRNIIKPLQRQIKNKTSGHMAHIPSHNQRKQNTQQNNYSVKNTPRLNNKNSDAETKDTRISVQRKQSYQDQQNKQNCQRNSNYNLKTSRPSQQLKSTKFFIANSSSRSKPITPRQAYQHSLKKWKKLPEIVARQKQKQKEAKMRERLIKMKAHSLEVRNKLKR